MKRIITIILAVVVLSTMMFGISSEKPKVKQSFYLMPFGNGLGAGIYQARKKGGRLLYFYDHIYKSYSAKGPRSKSYLKKKGITWGINDYWLDKATMKGAEYLAGTGIIKVQKTKKDYPDIAVSEYYFMPMSSDKRVMVAILELENKGDSRQKIKPYLYIDAYLGRKEEAKLKGNVFVERSTKKKRAKSFVLVSSEVDRYSYLPSKEYPKELKKQTIKPKNKIEAEGKNLIGVLRFAEIKLEKGEKTKILIVFGLAEKADEDKYIEEIKKIFDKGADKLIKDELAWWDNWHSVENMPKSLNAKEQRLFRQSTAVLKMGQCSEPGKPHGQILASLPPGEWNIAWPRDGAYSIVALARSGHHYEAKSALEFMLNAPGGKFTNEEYVGMPYKISVCRYYGNGDEESDLNQQGPNVEWDDFGLFLWAFAEYMKASNDKDFLAKHFDVVKEQIADVLVHLMSENGYLIRDSSIWERHWEPQNHPDGRKFFAYSTINAYNGLMLFSEFCPKDLAKSYVAKANKIKKGFLAHFIDETGIIVGSLEEKEQGIEKYIDGCVVEAINFGMVNERISTATLAAFEKYIHAKKSPGFFRNDDNTWYDRQEWVIIDLRIAAAYWRMGNKERALELFDWVLLNAEKNYYLVAELLEENSLAYKGAVPMCGFGAGCYVIDAYLMKGE